MNARNHNSLVLLLVLFLPMATARADSAVTAVEKGNVSYAKGNYDDALRQYQQPQMDDPNRPTILYNRANCSYKLEQFDTAIDYYRQASAESKDMQLVAKAKYNLGNSYFQRALKHKTDTNLQDTLEELATAVRYYRETLKINPQDQDARHNIAVARLTMKDILDAIKKQQEKQEQQQKQEDLAEKIKKLLERQVQTLQKTAALNQVDPDPNVPADAKQRFLEQITGEQAQLKDDTLAVGEEAQQNLSQLNQQQTGAGAAAPTSPPGSGPPDEKLGAQQEAMETVVTELTGAIDEQGNAIEQLEDHQLPPAGRAEMAAAQHLKNALDALSDPNQPQQQQGDQQQDQQGEDQQEKKDQQQDQTGRQDQSPQEQPDQQPDQQAAPPDTTAQAILDKEKQRREQQRKVRLRGYQPVDRDW